jgi:hypothetical protein
VLHPSPFSGMGMTAPCGRIVMGTRVSKMQIRYPEYWEVRDNENGLNEHDIFLCVTNEYSTDLVLSLDQLLELRAEIDKFLFTQVVKREG